MDQFLLYINIEFWIINPFPNEKAWTPLVQTLINNLNLKQWKFGSSNLLSIVSSIEIPDNFALNSFESIEWGPQWTFVTGSDALTRGRGLGTGESCGVLNYN